MDHHEFSNEIIRSIDRLRAETGPKIASANNLDNRDNLLAGIITPEWYYSGSSRILDNVDIGWDTLARTELVERVAAELHKLDFDNIKLEQFERSFSSWYQPYHFLPRTKWGIHIRYSSFKNLAAHFYRSCPSLMDNKVDTTKAAFLYMYIHQLFHHITENASSLMEIITGKQTIYERYYSEVYIKSFNSNECLEESLANRFLVEWTNECHIEKEFLKKELLKQTDGYKGFINYLDANFTKGKRRLLSQIKDGSLSPTSNEPLEIIMTVPNLVNFTRKCEIPIWLHHKPRPLH
jgi:hypothetical protein